jgi:cytochrome c biogenesis protein CcmG, thiol:disulfide interchange protein DsbE
LKFVVGLVCALVTLAALPATAQNGRWYPEDEPAPPLKLSTVGGVEIDLAALKGRMVIVNFWATWCGPCIAEMPSLQALTVKLGAKNVALLGVNFHESPQKIRDFQDKYQVKFPLLRDAWQEASAAWKVGVLPTTFIVDAKGTLRYRVVGEVDWSSKAVADRLNAITVKPSGATTARFADSAGAALASIQ